MKTGALSAAAAVLGSSAGAKEPKRVLRIAHLTDIHIQPEKHAYEGFLACLDHAERQKPDLILTGGDLIMDALGTTKERAMEQWNLLAKALKGVKTPVRHCIGNHDVWGWNNIASYEKDPRFGKQMALDVLEMERPYYAFEQAGWTFVVLDSTHRKEGNGYTARLDDEQFEWLSGQLASAPKNRPIFVLSHIPILSMSPFLDGDNEKSGDWRVPGAWMHIDARRIKDLFRKYPNVKLCASGHIHLADLVEYLGVTYVCNGAVSGGWWGGPYQEFEPAYALIDLFEDGTFSNRLVEYGWTPKPAL